MLERQLGPTVSFYIRHSVGAIDEDDGRTGTAIRSVNNSFIFSILSAKQIAYQQLMIEYKYLPDDYLIKYRCGIAQVKAEDIKKWL